MTILLVALYLEVKDYPTDEVIKSVTELLQDFGHGVVTQIKLHTEDTCTHVVGHVHVSTRGESCSDCYELATDKRS